MAAVIFTEQLIATASGVVRVSLLAEQPATPCRPDRHFSAEPEGRLRGRQRRGEGRRGRGGVPGLLGRALGCPHGSRAVRRALVPPDDALRPTRVVRRSAVVRTVVCGPTGRARVAGGRRAFSGKQPIAPTCSYCAGMDDAELPLSARVRCSWLALAAAWTSSRSSAVIPTSFRAGRPRNLPMSSAVDVADVVANTDPAAVVELVRLGRCPDTARAGRRWVAVARDPRGAARRSRAAPPGRRGGSGPDRRGRCRRDRPRPAGPSPEWTHPHRADHGEPP